MPSAPRRHTDVIREVVPLRGRRVLEVGCGGGALLGWLRRQEALPLGVEPDAAQLARAREGSDVPLVRALGEALPLADGSFDLVIYFNSLHHVPVALQGRAVAEAARVLAGEGHLLVIEPMALGSYFALLQPLEDETEVRRAAYGTLLAAETSGLSMLREETYDTRLVEASWAATRARFLAANPARAVMLEQVEDRLARMFEQLGEPVADGRAFSQPMRLNLLGRQPPAPR
jgi:SAM-dependent methyltransferase